MENPGLLYYIQFYFFYLLASITILFFGIITTPFRVINEYFAIKYPDIFRTKNDPANHKRKVEKIQDQVKKWNSNGRKGLLCSSRPSWKQFQFRDIDKSRMNRIDLDLEDIVEIDTKNKILTVEPWMTMGTLTHKLLQLGWTVPVIPEFEELTVGGLICGAGIETSSHKYGLFFQSCLGYEVVVANGDCVTCSKDENSDLFESIPMSLGTVGFITAVKLPLLPVKKFVQLRYHQAKNPEAALKLLRNEEHEFVEGIQYSKNKFVIIYGDFVDRAPSNKTVTFTRWNDLCYHWDTEKYFYKVPGETQFVPTRDYYHRHQKGYFWAETSFLPFFKYWIIRNTIGWALPLHALLGKRLNMAVTGKYSNLTLDGMRLISYFLQDFTIPIEKAPEILDMIFEGVNVSPIWLCPVKISPTNGMTQPANNKETLYLNVGVYGIAQKPQTNYLTIWKKIEHFTLMSKGFVWFYTDTFLNKDEFEQMFNTKLYMSVRKKYGCDGAFPYVFDKINGPQLNKKTL